MWTVPNTTIREKCSCGAETSASGPFAASVVAEWRSDHRHLAARPAPNPGVLGDPNVRCGKGQCVLGEAHEGKCKTW